MLAILGWTQLLLHAIAVFGFNATFVRPFVLAKLNETSGTVVEAAIVSDCPAEPDINQKNWQALLVDDRLLYVTRTFPLTIVEPHGTGCSVVQNQSTPQPHLQRSFVARGIDNKCWGSSNYLQTGYAGLLPDGTRSMNFCTHFPWLKLPCRPDEWLSVVHTFWGKGDGMEADPTLHRVYTHYFVSLTRAEGVFTVDWVSEPWRSVLCSGFDNLLGNCYQLPAHLPFMQVAPQP